MLGTEQEGQRSMRGGEAPGQPQWRSPARGKVALMGEVPASGRATEVGKGEARSWGACTEWAENQLYKVATGQL
jgi:hypothetical protein